MDRDPADQNQSPAPDAPSHDGPHDDEPASPSGKRHKKDKKHKKEKKHKHHKEHKEKKHKKHEKDRDGGEVAAEPAAAATAEPEPAAAAAAEPAAAEPAAAAAAEAEQQPKAAQPLSLPNGAAELPSPDVAGQQADLDGDHEEGELPDAGPPSPRSGAGQEPLEAGAGRDGRDRPSRRSRSRSPARDRDRGRERGAADRDRDRERLERRGRAEPRDAARGQSRSPGGDSDGGRRERSPQRNRDERRREEEGRHASRDRPSSRPPSRPRSRSPERRPAEQAERGLDRSRFDDRDRGRLPPRPYDRDRPLGVDRRRGADDWRRQEEERRRGSGGGWEDRHRGGPGGRDWRSRSRSRSRERRKRDRSSSRERQRRDDRKGEQEDDEEFQKRVAAALEGQGGDEDEDRLIEERRRRRQEILAKHREQQQLSESIAAPTATALRRDVSVNFQPGADESAPPTAPPSAPVSVQPSPTRQPAASSGATAPAAAAAAAGPASCAVPPSPEPGPGPNSDEEEEAAPGEGGMLDIWKHEEEQAAAGEGITPSQEQAAAGTKTGIGEDDGELAKRVGIRRNVDVDMFAEEDDIFAATPPEAKQAAAQADAGPVAAAAAAPAAAAIKKGLLDNYDDAEGYYNFQVGEVLADKYEVVVSLGKGVFSSVLRARDITRKELETNQHPEVAIKVIRANETMYKAGQMEKVILRKLSEADKDGRRHCIRMLSTFEYRNHLCLVFESLDLNLRELTKRYGRGIGLSINAVRIYSQQMLVALHHLKNCGVLHADIKPDNILVNERRTVVKLCDFGSAMFTGDNEITPYLVSRFYRPPEVILGLPYDHPMDMWSVGCVIYELFTGHILFPGKTNNEMLKLMMDVKGPFPKKMLKKAEFAFKHFENDPNISFALLEEDPVTKRPVRRLIPAPAIKADFTTLLAGQSPDRRKLAQLADLLERMMALDPDKRISPKDALRHPFIKEAPTAPLAKAGAK